MDRPLAQLPHESGLWLQRFHHAQNYLPTLQLPSGLYWAGEAFQARIVKEFHYPWKPLDGNSELPLANYFPSAATQKAGLRFNQQEIARQCPLYPKPDQEVSYTKKYIQASSREGGDRGIVKVVIIHNTCCLPLRAQYFQPSNVLRRATLLFFSCKYPSYMIISLRQSRRLVYIVISQNMKYLFNNTFLARLLNVISLLSKFNPFLTIIVDTFWPNSLSLCL